MMKKGEVILLILVVIGILFFSGCSSEPTATTQQPAVSAKVIASGCAWRLNVPEQFGPCDSVLGAYFDGVSCSTVSGCADQEGIVPFKDIDSCKQKCVASEEKVEASPIKEFKIEAKQFEFVPGTITVNQGDKIRLIVTSTDVDHGVGIPEFGVSLKVPAGETGSVEFVADKKGAYTMQCNVFCGEGHKNMKGSLVVQ